MATSTGPAERPIPDAAAQHIRGSSLLLAGRFIAYGIEFATQVLLVRALSKSDFGAFSYALSVIVLFQSIAVLELPNTLARYIPVYRERQAPAALIGATALALGTVVLMGVLMAAAIAVAVGPLGFQPTQDPTALDLLRLLAVLIPLEALSALLTALFAALAGAAQIAFRQILMPALKFAVVAALALTGAGVTFLAAGYVLATGVTALVYLGLFAKNFLSQPWFREWRPRKLVLPTREIFSFALPLLASTLVWMLMESSDAVLLGYFWDTEAVAAFRAVLPIPRVLATLTMTFSVLYTPLVSRLYARGQHDDVAHLYRRSAVWMTVLSFPVFALGFSFAPSTVATLYGTRYADSTAIMALLSLGYYFFAVTGFNGLTLKIYRHLRFAVAADVAAACLNVVLNLLLIPAWGPLGAAVGTAGTMLVHNALKQYGLWRHLRINLFQPRYLAVYVSIFVMALALLVLQMALPASLWLALPLIIIGTIVILWLARDTLELDATFPELRRWPVVGTLIAWWLK